MIWGKQTAAAVPAVPGWMLLVLAALLLFVGYRAGRRRRAPRWLAAALAVAVALVPAALVHATSTFGVPFTFTNGTVADATQVNQNFSAVTTEINNNLRAQTAITTECEFHGRASNVIVDCGGGQGGASIVAPGDNVLVGPVHVPQGATLTSVDVWLSDTNASINEHVCLFVVLDAIGGFDESIPCVTSSGTPGIEKLTITPPAGTLQGNGGSFEIFAYPTDASGNAVSWPTDVSLTIRTAYAHYVVP
jgi:hypothetical protein